jgi:hypothetical protein
MSRFHDVLLHGLLIVKKTESDIEDVRGEESKPLKSSIGGKYRPEKELHFEQKLRNYPMCSGQNQNLSRMDDTLGKSHCPEYLQPGPPRADSSQFDNVYGRHDWRDRAIGKIGWRNCQINRWRERDADLVQALLMQAEIDQQRGNVARGKLRLPKEQDGGFPVGYHIGFRDRKSAEPSSHVIGLHRRRG